MNIDQNTLNKMADGTVKEVSFNETLELCLLGLAEKLDLAEEE